ncbi:restriction endonuclease subunit S [Morganella morganii subsp. morganii]|uniref:restriction endonuclease subunit S n=1 Tax=Morganella morganii TaxID=582 RepID=UPI00159F55C0|nr:restriction endonuclease subunit S [Morganella morganii]MBT0331553.1 restriction endonuclease subunit S [Morganella morganii subsp. morganii]MBT0393598.1 restriction endonuclease subunit S [Morganella morganii subsp. morganii]QLB45671.1 restriction endonuclease subunit S [Morganella morganii]HCD1111292.1 restriction endonuclease subunit S [Morganella morganii]
MTVEKLITDHIDIWSSALQTRSAAGRGSNGKIDLYGIKKLRELILELAVRGKLVPQDPNDEPASELLKRIAAEKAELVKQGKIKKQKLLPEISEDEKPFELPAGWEWVRLNHVGHDWGQKTPENDFTYIDVGSINKELGTISKPGVINPKDAPSRARKIVRRNTVLYSTVRPYLLNIAVVDEDYDPEPIASTAFAIIHPWKGISSTFIYHYLRSPIFVSYVESCQTGIAYPAINDKQFLTGVIAIPPAEEQLRIVSKVNELMSLCDQLEQQSLLSLDAHQQLVETLLATLTDSQNAKELAENWVRISQHFDMLFTTEASIDALKQTILQLAVMGKLVPQDPDDEPASELLKRIEQEKTQLVKEGKIKKQKPLPPVSDEEKPFELPVGWEWCRIIEIAQVGTGATPSRDNPDYWETPEFNWVTSGETSLPFIFNTAEKISGKAVKETNVSIYSPGTLIIAMYGQGKTRGQITELCISAGTNQACAAIQLFNTNEYHRCYIKLFFEKSYKDLRELAAGGAQPNLNLAKVSNTLVPIPPLSEQIKITCKVEELIKVCDTLKSRLQSAQQTRLHLADALTDAALN